MILPGVKNVMLGRSGPFKKTWDYRVAYFQTTTKSNHGYFVLPAAADLNPAIAVSTSDYLEFFFSTAYAKKITFGFAPGATVSADNKFFGNVWDWMFLGTYGSKWRLAGKPPGGWMDPVIDAEFTTNGGSISV